MLNNRMRAVREQKGLTQRELGQLCQMDVTQISRYERGASDPTMHTLKTIANQPGVSTDYLLGLTDDPHRLVREPALNVDERPMLESYRRVSSWRGANVEIMRSSKGSATLWL